MVYILDSISINEIGEEWIRPKNTLIRIRRNKSNIEFAQVGHLDVEKYYRE